MPKLKAHESVYAFLLGSLLGAQVLGAQPPGPLFVTIPAVEMVHGELAGKVINQVVSNGGWSAYCDGLCEFVADARLPHGAVVLGIEIDACRDASGDGTIAFALVRRLPGETLDAGFPVQALIEGAVNNIGCGYRFAVPAVGPVLVDQWGGEYLVYARIGSLLCGFPGNDPCPDGGSRFQSMRVYYESNGDGGVVEPSKRSDFNPLPPP